MGIAKTTLEYVSLTTGNWVKAVTPDGNDAVVMLAVEQSINTSAKADIILSNRSPNPTSAVASEAKGLLTDVFSDFQRIRLIHQEKGIPVFSGRIYDIRNKYDLTYGQTIRIVAFDAYKEILQFPIDDASDTLEEVDTTDSDEGGYDLRKRSQVIKYMLDEIDLKDKNLLTTDVNQFEDSWSTDSLGDKKLNLTKIDRNVGGVIFDLAISDPVKTQGGVHIGESGYDYRVEPRWVSSAATSTPKESLHYFMRGTRPGKGGAYGASAAPVLTTTSTDSLTIEYAGTVPDSGLKQTMMSVFEFDHPKEELRTSVVLHYTDEGKEDESNDDESPVKTEGVVTFELLKGSALSGTFTWALKALDASKNTTNIPELLDIQGGATGVARVQWQNSSGYLLLISDINETTFPTTGTRVLVGASSGATFTFNAATGRMKTKYGVERPTRIQRNLTSDLGMLRDEVVTRLVGQLDLKIIRGKFQTLEYPVIYHDLPSNSSRSSNTITWSGTVAAQTRGVRVGNIVAEINASGEYVRYAYISAVTNNTSITYGASATDTSDETALDSSNTIRLVIPLRPGDVVKVKNATSGIDTDQVILSLGYDESPGMFATRYETVGSNNKFSNIYSEAEEIRAAVAAATPKKFPPAKPLGEVSVDFQGNINRGSNPSDEDNYRRIHWTTPAGATSGAAGKLILGDGSKYTIACANSAILTADPHYIFFRPTKARASANTSDTTFQVVLKTSYTQDPDDVMIGWCHAVDSKPNAQAVLYITASGFDSKNLFAAGQNGSITEALLSKSAQEYNSLLAITPIAENHTNYAAAGHRHVVWAAATIKFADGDNWNIVAGGNDLSSPYYSVTDNGTSYSNIDILAPNSTYYAYIDTSEASSGGSLNLRLTTDYSRISTHTDGTFSSAKVLVAQIVVPETNSDGFKEPAIFPFGNRTLTLNAASIAAGAITATHITASKIVGKTLATHENVDVSGGPAGIKISNDGIEGFSGGTTRVFHLDPATGKCVFGTTSQDTIANINKWSYIIDDDGNKAANNATVGASWNSNVSGQPSDAQILNSNLTITIDSNGVFSLGNGGSTTDQRAAELKRRIFRQDTIPAGPYATNDMWITSVTFSTLSHRGTSICTTAASTGQNINHWQRVSPPSSILTADTVTVDGGNLTANTVTAGTLTSSFVLTNTIIAGSGTINLNLYGVALGVLPNNEVFIVQKNGVDMLTIDTSGNIALNGTITLSTGGTIGAASTANQDSTLTILGGNHTGNVNGVGGSTITSGAALGASAHQPGASETRTAGTVGGWKLSSTALFTGNSADTYSYSADGEITLTSNGEIHTPVFFIESNGTSGFKGTLDIGGTSGNNLRLTSTSITGYKSGSAKVKIDSSGAALTCYGPGGTQANAALLLVNGGYISYISAGTSGSDTRYDAAEHEFYNFSGAYSFISGIRNLSLSEPSNTCSIDAENNLDILTQGAGEDIRILRNNSLNMGFYFTYNESNKDFIPAGNRSLDLGASVNKWDTVYCDDVDTSDIHLSNLEDGNGNDFDGTTGDWTIQEGSDELYIRNNVTGKKYKFKLEEI